MRLGPDYFHYQAGAWSLWVRRQQWREELWNIVLAHIERQPPSKHPQTLQLKGPFETTDAVLFLKIFHGSSGFPQLKDVFRASRARRSMSLGVDLARCNFNVPLALAAGEERQYRLLRKAFVLTLGVPGQALPVFLRQRSSGSESISWLEKRDGLQQLALEVRRLHRLGFVHGDLVPTNIFMAHNSEQRSCFFLMDNDRTRRYPKWFPQFLWRRNLVQLNRIPLPGVMLQDRVRFLKYYLDLKEWGSKERRLLSWLERKTRQRRRECDSIDATGSFRRLMEWQGDPTKDGWVHNV